MPSPLFRRQINSHSYYNLTNHGSLLLLLLDLIIDGGVACLLAALPPLLTLSLLLISSSAISNIRLFFSLFVSLREAFEVCCVT